MKLDALLPVAAPAPAGLMKTAAEFVARHAVPMLALSPAAYITYQHMTRRLGYDQLPSVVMSAAVELLGYVVTDTAIKAINEKQYIVALTSFVSFGGYIIVIVSVNTALNIAKFLLPGFEPFAHVLAEGVLVLLSVPAVLWAAARSTLAQVDAKETAQAAQAFDLQEQAKDNEHRRKMEDKKLAAELRKLENKPAQVVQVAEQVPQVEAKKKRGRVDLVRLAQELASRPDATNEELAKLFDVSGEAVRLARQKITSGTGAA